MKKRYGDKGLLIIKGININKGFGAEGGTRTRMGFPTRPSNVRVYQFHHFGRGERKISSRGTEQSLNIHLVD